MLLGPNIEEQIREEERIRQEEKQRREAEDQRRRTEQAEAERRRQEDERKRREEQQREAEPRAAEQAKLQRQAEEKQKAEQDFWAMVKVVGGVAAALLVIVVGIVVAAAIRSSGKPNDSSQGTSSQGATIPSIPGYIPPAAASPSYTAPSHVSAPTWDDRTPAKTPCSAAKEEKQQAPAPWKPAPEAKPSTYTPPPRSVPTTIQVHMPADADLYANGVLMPGQRGQSERTFAAPERPEGSDQKYYFTVRDRNGLTQQQVVGFQAGESKSVDLGGGFVRPPPIPYRP